MRVTNILLGTSSWVFEDWKGVFYPARPTDELAHYARRFDTVEIDASFYHTPAKRVVESWRRRVPDNFRFAAKVPRTITHDKLLLNCKDDLFEFLDSIRCLEEKLGPILFQFPPYWSADEGRSALRDFLPLLPSGWKFAIEFRHRTWFEDETANLLQDYNVAWTLSDFGSFWTVKQHPPIYTTADFAYIRWLGDRREPLEPFDEIKKERDYEDEQWALTIASLPVDEVWGFFSNHWAGHSPASVDAFKKRLGLPIKNEAPGGQQSLF
jgi:uncharacterized protein YecE (DUF72 family)